MKCCANRLVIITSFFFDYDLFQKKKHSKATIPKDFLWNGKDWLYLLRQSNGVAITFGESKEKTDPPTRRMRFPKVSQMLMSFEVFVVRIVNRTIYPRRNSFSIWQYIQSVAIHPVADLSLRFLGYVTLFRDNIIWFLL